MGENVSVVDFNKFRNELEIDDETLKELYTVFLDELIMQKYYMKTQIEKRELDELKKTMHNIKGISGNYRVNKVWELSSRIYDDLKIEGRSNNELNYLINKIEKLIDEAIDKINEFLS